MATVSDLNSRVLYSAVIITFVRAYIHNTIVTTLFQKADDNTPLCDRVVGHLRKMLCASRHRIRTWCRVLAVVMFFILVLAGSGQLFLNSSEKVI